MNAHTPPPETLDVVAAYPAPIPRKLCRRCLITLGIAVLIPIGLGLLLRTPVAYDTASVGRARDAAAVSIPVQALLFAPAEATGSSLQPRVWVLRAGKPVAVPVALGTQAGERIDIVGAGLHPGDQVIVAAHRKR